MRAGRRQLGGGDDGPGIGQTRRAQRQAASQDFDRSRGDGGGARETSGATTTEKDSDCPEREGLALEVSVTREGPCPTAAICTACGAASWSASPSWLALIVHVPAAWKRMVLPEALQIAAVNASTANMTGFPEAPPTAATS